MPAQRWAGPALQGAAELQDGDLRALAGAPEGELAERGCAARAGPPASPRQGPGLSVPATFLVPTAATGAPRSERRAPAPSHSHCRVGGGSPMGTHSSARQGPGPLVAVPSLCSRQRGRFVCHQWLRWAFPASEGRSREAIE